MDWIKLDKAHKTKPLYWQLTDAIRQAVSSGLLPANYKLPSSRTLAKNLDISRNVVITAYEQLAIEGYLTSKGGSGNYVQSGVQHISENIERQSERLSEVRPTTNDCQRKTIIDFRPGVPALNLFPAKLWGQLTKDVCQTTRTEEFGYGDSAGSFSLRQVLSSHLRLYREIECGADQIVITGGAAQSFAIIGRILAKLAEEAILEDPSTKAIRFNLTESGLKILPINVDEQGLKTEKLPADNLPRAIFVTPSHQFPLGGVMSIQRRIELVDFARRSSSYIVEDDYDSEFRHHGSPLPTLRELAPERVVYVGTFSKMLFPGLRLGYAILPSTLIAAFTTGKRANDLQSPILEQLTLARFIEDGHLGRHIMQMKKVYARRRATIIESLQNAFDNNIQIIGDATGLHLIAQFPSVHFTANVLLQIKEKGVKIYPVEEHAIVPGRWTRHLIFGYGNLSVEQIQDGITKLASAL
jgi:GntR family transcriptional regulator/MocR family aminotransferase